jgi:flagellar motor protein MotB
VRVEGHTDSDPIKRSDWGTNERLSEARAQAVRTLLENAGVTAGAITTAGYGAGQPLEPGATTRAKSRNRRVEIFLAPR